MIDCSGSMKADGKMQALNTAVRETLPMLVEAAESNIYTAVFLRSISFSTGARWHIETPTPIDNVRWTDVEAGGYTDLGEALDLLLNALDGLEARSIPPGVLLISDGQPTDDYRSGLARLAAHPWGARSQRIAIAIGTDADEEFLAEFTGPSGLVLSAHEPDRVAHELRFAGESLLSDRFKEAPRAATAEELRTAGPVWDSE